MRHELKCNAMCMKLSKGGNSDTVSARIRAYDSSRSHGYGDLARSGNIAEFTGECVTRCIALKLESMAGLYCHRRLNG